MNYILFGFKGSGKSTFGKKLAKELDRRFIDLDALIEQAYQKSIREIYHEVGEDSFRKIEKEQLQKLVDQTHCVIALGGGTVLDPENVKLLQTMGELIYLKASFETIQKRIQQTPLFVVDSLKQVYEARLPVYESISAICIEND